MALIFLARRVIERFQMAESLERIMRLTYNEFRKAHKGTPQKEISELWKRYKANEYDLPPELLNEAPVEEGERLLGDAMIHEHRHIPVSESTVPQARQP